MVVAHDANGTDNGHAASLDVLNVVTAYNIGLMAEIGRVIPLLSDIQQQLERLRRQHGGPLADVAYQKGVALLRQDVAAVIARVEAVRETLPEVAHAIHVLGLRR